MLQDDPASERELTSTPTIPMADVWAEARQQLEGLPDGRGLNIAHEAVVRHAAGPTAERTAIRWLGRRGDRLDLTYADLDERSNRFANLLRSLGAGRGDAVFLLLGRIPELYVSLLGTLKNTSVVSPLFAAFGPEPIRQRMSLGDARILVTTEALYRRKVEPIRSSLPRLEHVLVVPTKPGLPPPHATFALDHCLAEQSEHFEIPPTAPDDLALVHFTSGTTGTPKGAMHVHEAVVAHHATGQSALDLRAGDTFWCTADPGWVTGTSYGVISPLTIGATLLVDEGEFEAERWYRTLQDEKVDVWYTAPTAIRMLVRAGTDLARTFDLHHLRFVASVGEPLDASAVRWSEDAFGSTIHDNWWQTETGGIMIANQQGRPIKPGSMGTPLPGVEATVLARDPDPDGDGAVLVVGDAADTVVELTEPDEAGHLALRPGWPSMFRGYLGDPDRYASCFAGGWYISGDLVRRDEDGYFWFVGRADDVIKSAGHLIGPFEVESTLLAHPAVAEAAVIGIPDPVAGALVKAVVTLHDGYQPSDELAMELIGFARSRLGPAVAPRQIGFDQALPHTRSGKIMRRMVRARELGLPEGDTSALEGGPPS